VEDLLYRILSRKIIIRLRGLEYIINAPDVDLKYRAEIYRQGLIEEYKYDLPRLEGYNLYLIKNRFIEADFQNKIKNMNDTIRKFKIQLYQAGPRIETQKKVRESLRIMKEKLGTYYNSVELYQRNSLEYFAESLKNKFLLINTVKLDNNLALDSQDIDLDLMSKLVDELNKKDITTTQFRDIALSENWRSYYLSNKYNLFGIPAADFSEEQKILCGYTRMYYNCYENPDCPSEEVMKDHDRFDGWLFLEQDKRKDEKKQKNVTDLDPKYQEVFKPAENQEEANSIYEANTVDGKRILKERAKVIKNNDEVKDIQFRDVRLDAMASSAKAESAHFKNIGK
jgi:hypothetical protein